MRLITLLVGVALAVTARADTETFDFEGKAKVNCICVAGKPGCASKILDELSGAERHTWTYEIHVKKDLTVDLNEVCWRKRNADKLGQGLCCDAAGVTDEVEMRQFYKGSL